MKSKVAVGLVGVLALSLATVASWRAATAQQEAQRNLDTAMQEKLTEAQRLLAALAVEDFEQIEESAHALVRISLEAMWAKPDSPTFGNLGVRFRDNANSIADMAEAENLDGATLHYLSLVMTCVECHKMVRGVEEVAWLNNAVRAVPKA
ncbi:MAG: hypothetical protein WD873_01845 [Candidatus Hydrogenedentales bacterium]